MPKKRSRKERPVFSSIRKPIAPASQKLGKDKPEEKIHPAGRKTKHKGKVRPDENDGDV
jgi:hypothetical protein